MLIKCPECELQVSDKALSCPHCGYPLQDGAPARKPRSKSNKRKRLPNGFGQISKIKNRNLKNPFRVMVTVGKDEKGKPIPKLLKPDAFFPTYNDAYNALVEYHKNPYDLDLALTMSELFVKWGEDHRKKLKNPESFRNMEMCWRYCSAIYSMRAMDVRPRHIKGCMEDGTCIVKGVERHTTPSLKLKIKSMFNVMFDYALEYEIVDKNYARTFNVSDEVIKENEDSQKDAHIPYTEEEMETLWNNIDRFPTIETILIQCYSGWRPQELGLIRLENVDLENGTFSGGMKTDAGIDRIVPIHSKILDLVKKKYDEAVELHSEYLLNATGKFTKSNDLMLTYDKFKSRYYTVRDNLHLNPTHKPHDGRKHFITMAKKYKVDEYAIKYMVGHEISDLTERIYTKREISWLKEEIEKIK